MEDVVVTKNTIGDAELPIAISQPGSVYLTDTSGNAYVLRSDNKTKVIDNAVTEAQKSTTFKVTINSGTGALTQNDLKQYVGTYTLTVGGAKEEAVDKGSSIVADTSSRAKLSVGATVDFAGSRSMTFQAIVDSDGLISIKDSTGTNTLAAAAVAPELTLNVAVEGETAKNESNEYTPDSNTFNVMVAAWLA